MTDRKLASVQKIINISPIEGADRIEVATVLGWKCVVAKKDNFNVGDLVVYFEIDSILPDLPMFEFMKDRKYKVKTIKLRKQISQGLVMPLSILPDKNWKEGDDVTNVLRVTKHDPQAEQEERENNIKKSQLERWLRKQKWYKKLFPKKRGGFPNWIKKTDEDRIQLFPNYYYHWKDLKFIVTEKVDGQSLTVFIVKNKKLFFRNNIEFGVCSRNLKLNKPNNSSWWTVAKYARLKEKLLQIPFSKTIVLQGEILGQGIQGNKYKIRGYELYIFNLIVDGKIIDSITAKEILDKLNLKFVPILEKDFSLFPTMQEMVDYAKGKSVLFDTLREGLVLRNYENNISFKVINPEFLLKNDV